MKKIEKAIYFFIIILCFTFFLNTNLSYAKKVEDDIKDFKAESTAPDSVTGLKDVVKNFLVAIRVASSLLLVVVIATSGIRYITAPANLKGEIKKNGLAVALGLVFTFGASYFAAFMLDVFGV